MKIKNNYQQRNNNNTYEFVYIEKKKNGNTNYVIQILEKKFLNKNVTFLCLSILDIKVLTHLYTSSFNGRS